MTLKRTVIYRKSCKRTTQIRRLMFRKSTLSVFRRKTETHTKKLHNSLLGRNGLYKHVLFTGLQVRPNVWSSTLLPAQ